MRINTIFGDLKASGLKESERVRVQDLIREIVTERRKIPLNNDVCDLYESRETVAKYLGLPETDLDVLWSVPTIKAHLELCGYDLTRVADIDMQEVESKAFGDEEGEGESHPQVTCNHHLIVDAVTNAVQTATVGHTRALHGVQRQMFWFGAAIMFLHAAFAFGAVKVVCDTRAFRVLGSAVPAEDHHASMCGDYLAGIIASVSANVSTCILTVVIPFKDACVGSFTEFLRSSARVNAWFV